MEVEVELYVDVVVAVVVVVVVAVVVEEEVVVVVAAAVVVVVVDGVVVDGVEVVVKVVGAVGQLGAQQQKRWTDPNALDEQMFGPLGVQAIMP